MPSAIKIGVNHYFTEIGLFFGYRKVMDYHGSY